MKKYKVCFEQINQTVVEVKADCYENAIEKAIRKWRRDEGWPITTYYEIIDEIKPNKGV